MSDVGFRWLLRRMLLVLALLSRLCSLGGGFLVLGSQRGCGWAVSKKRDGVDESGVKKAADSHDTVGKAVLYELLGGGSLWLLALFFPLSQDASECRARKGKTFLDKQAPKQSFGWK